MRDFSPYAPCCLRYCYHRIGIKNRFSPHTLLTSGGTSRDYPNHRSNPLHLAKTRPLCPYSASGGERPPLLTNNLSSLFNSSGRVRRPQPDPAAENSSIFFDCTPWLNNLSSSNSTPDNPASPYHIYCYNGSGLYDIGQGELHQNHYLGLSLDEVPYTKCTGLPDSPFSGRTTTPYWIHA